MKRLRLPSPALVVALISLCVALSGTAAADQVASAATFLNPAKVFKKNSIPASKLKTIPASKLKSGIPGSKIDVSSLRKVPAAKLADSAGSASFANTSGSATNATNATNATTATNASNAASASNADKLDNLDSNQFVHGTGSIHLHRTDVLSDVFGVTMLTVPGVGQLIGSCSDLGQASVVFKNLTGAAVDVVRRATRDGTPSVVAVSTLADSESTSPLSGTATDGGGTTYEFQIVPSALIEPKVTTILASSISGYGAGSAGDPERCRFSMQAIRQ